MIEAKITRPSQLLCQSTSNVTSHVIKLMRLFIASFQLSKTITSPNFSFTPNVEIQVSGALVNIPCHVPPSPSNKLWRWLYRLSYASNIVSCPLSGDILYYIFFCFFLFSYWFLLCFVSDFGVALFSSSLTLSWRRSLSCRNQSIIAEQINGMISLW